MYKNVVDILSSKVPVIYPEGNFVYFLIDGDEIVYVGQTSNLAARIKDHSYSKGFDSFSYVSCNKEDSDKLEAFYIYTLNPKLNKSDKSGVVKITQLKHIDVYNIFMNNELVSKLHKKECK